MILKSCSIGRNALMIASFKVRLSRCCGGIGCPSLVERVSFGKKDTLGRGRGHGDREKAGTGAEEKVRWAGAGFSWKFGAGGAMGEVRGKRPGGSLSERRRGVSGGWAGGEQDGPGWLHQRALNGPGDEQLVSVASDFSDHASVMSKRPKPNIVCILSVLSSIT